MILLLTIHSSKHVLRFACTNLNADLRLVEGNVSNISSAGQMNELYSHV